jgi:hypothetical protein
LQLAKKSIVHSFNLLSNRLSMLTGHWRQCMTQVFDTRILSGCFKDGAFDRVRAKKMIAQEYLWGLAGLSAIL